MKMDLANLQRKLKPDAELLVPWKRLEASIDAGIDMKRRVIENLRPTLLDNLGLIAALRWHAEEACTPAHIDLEIDAPEDEMPVPSEVGHRDIPRSAGDPHEHAKAREGDTGAHVDPQSRTA